VVGIIVVGTVFMKGWRVCLVGMGACCNNKIN